MFDGSKFPSLNSCSWLQIGPEYRQLPPHMFVCLQIGKQNLVVLVILVRGGRGWGRGARRRSVVERALMLR